MYQKGNNGGRGNQMTPPVNVGDEVDVKIEALGGKGDGIAKIRGFVLFVPGVKEGESCKVRVTKVLRSVGFAEKIGEASAPIEGAEGAPAEIAAEPEAPVEDTEDFGEEDSEKEEPAEEDSGEDNREEF